MKKNISFWMLGIAAMLASCSQDEVLQGMDNSGGVQTVTLTASMGDMKTRAVSYDSDDDITQCRLELWQDGARVGNSIVGEVSEDKRTCTFTFSAKQGAYDVLIWASDGSYTVEDLSNVTVNGEKPGIAYHTKTTVSEIAQNMTATLTHAVAKITLKTTTALPAGGTLSVTIPTYSSFSVESGDIIGTATEKDFAPESVTELPEGGGEVFSFYILAHMKQADVIAKVPITYNGEIKEATNVPVQANYRTVLIGNITNLADGFMTASLNENWEDNGENTYPGIVEATAADGVITTGAAGQIAETPSLIATAVGTGNTLAITGPMNEDDIKTIQTYLKDNSGISLALNLEGAKELTVLPGSNTITNGVTDWPGLVSIVLPEGLTTISSYAFWECTDLTEVTLPSTLETIGSSAFAYCSGLTAIELPKSLKTLQYSAFFGCTSLTTIDLSGTEVAEINAGVFRGCSSLTSVSFGPDTNKFCNTVFVGCSSLTTIDLSLCEEVPTFSYSTSLEEESPFYGLDMSNITIYVKDAAMKTAFESSAWVSRVGFSASNFVVKSNQ